jgi:hypothetical protein
VIPLGIVVTVSCSRKWHSNTSKMTDDMLIFDVSTRESNWCIFNLSSDSIINLYKMRIYPPSLLPITWAVHHVLYESVPFPGIGTQTLLASPARFQIDNP